MSEELPAATFVAIPFSCSDGACGQMLQRSPVGKENSNGKKKKKLSPISCQLHYLQLKTNPELRTLSI